MNAGSSADPTRPSTWRARVATYVEDATAIANSIDLILDETRMGSASHRSGEIDAATQQLCAAVSELERIVQRRDALLRATDAPPFGLSLSEKLLSTRRIDDARMARCCGEAADLVARTHQRATSLLICQYHLTGIPRELVARLSSSTMLQTILGSRQSPKSNGGRFNEAA